MVDGAENRTEEREPLPEGSESKLKYEEGRAAIGLKRRSYWLLVGCVAAALVVGIVGAILERQGLDGSGALSQVFDLLKSIITLLIGYVFAEKSLDR